MQIHVARNTTPLGVYSQEEVVDALNNGQLMLTDLAWREGMPTWVPLADWPEFKSVITASPFISSASGLDGAGTTVPWEKAKSLGMFWATIKGAIVDPKQTFAAGRFKFSDYILFSYLGVLFYLPFALYGQLQSPHLNQQIADLLRSFNNPALDSAIQGLLESAEQPVYYGIVGFLCFAVIYPFVLAAGGFLQWLGLKILRQKVSIEQSMVSSIVGVAVANLCFAPFVLTMSVAWLYLALIVLLWIPILVLHCRASAAVIKVSPGILFCSWIILSLIFCLCCCCFIGSLGFLFR
jgi:hypothetical protein